jgi:hypothetical protein
MANSEVNMLTQSNGEQWWTDRLESKKRLEGEHSGLFSPLSSNQNRGEFATPLDNLPQDDLKHTVKRMQHGFAAS